MDGLIWLQQQQLLLQALKVLYLVKEFASIKVALILGNNGVNATNKSFDLIEITNDGTYQLQIGSICFPQLCLNSGTNRYAILQGLQKVKIICMILKKV